MVVTILGLIASVVGISMKTAMETARADTARVQIGRFGEALDLYRVKFYRYPSTTEGLTALMTPPRGEGLVPDVPDDPWGAPYIYKAPSTQDRRGFELYSKGPDNQEGTDDDIR